jgi:hypothetical protein
MTVYCDRPFKMMNEKTDDIILVLKLTTSQPSTEHTMAVVRLDNRIEIHDAEDFLRDYKFYGWVG